MNAIGQQKLTPGHEDCQNIGPNIVESGCKEKVASSWSRCWGYLVQVESHIDKTILFQLNGLISSELAS